jgi:hypothetical protein
MNPVSSMMSEEITVDSSTIIAAQGLDLILLEDSINRPTPMKRMSDRNESPRQQETTIGYLRHIHAHALTTSATQRPGHCTVINGFAAASCCNRQ